MRRDVRIVEDGGSAVVTQLVGKRARLDEVEFGVTDKGQALLLQTRLCHQSTAILVQISTRLNAALARLKPMARSPAP